MIYLLRRRNLIDRDHAHEYVIRAKSEESARKIAVITSHSSESGSDYKDWEDKTKTFCEEIPVDGNDRILSQH